MHIDAVPQHVQRRGSRGFSYRLTDCSDRVVEGEIMDGRERIALQLVIVSIVGQRLAPSGDARSHNTFPRKERLGKQPNVGGTATEGGSATDRCRVAFARIIDGVVGHGGKC
uniref:Uncharacterized protein n=1 Tax=Alexandrium catenella TaxID=2925 RepID=A0A7S1LY73_ALECA